MRIAVAGGTGWLGSLLVEELRAKGDEPDRIDLGYYLGKRRQEEIVLRHDVPGTVVRVTQFHEFPAKTLAAKGPFVIAPKMLCQPVAVAEVGTHLADIVHQEPLGMAPELAGPEEHQWLRQQAKP